MQIYTDPPEKKLLKLVDGMHPDAVFLHHTGKMPGMGCRISSREGIKRIVETKQRNDKAGLIALVPDYLWFEDHGIKVPLRLQNLARQYWPGNLTLIWSLEHELTSEISYNGKVAFRVPTDPLIRTFIDMLDEPIVSTSVNFSNLPAETDMKIIQDRYGKWFDFALLPHPRRLRERIEPSTIVEYIEKDDPGNDNYSEDIRCLREGSIPFYEIKQAFYKPTIMFVCTANICRSPIAEKLFNFYANQAGSPFVGDSSGLLQGGHEISMNSMTLLLEKGIEEAQHHVSKELTPQLASGSRLILTMEERQRDHIRKTDPEAAPKVFTLNEYVGESGDIVDPYGSELDNYRKTYGIIEERILKLLDKLKNS